MCSGFPALSAAAVLGGHVLAVSSQPTARFCLQLVKPSAEYSEGL